MTDHRHDEKHTPTPWYRSRSGAALAGFLLVALYFLLSEHRAHFVSFLPYLLLLACPLMHMFMHGGHDRHGGSNDKPDKG